MARPLKTGLNYFPLDVDFFDDPRIGAVTVEHGIKGQAAVIMLLCAIYRNGYYVKWTPENRVALLKQQPGISFSKIEKIVATLVEWDFFNRELFEQQQVLTSRDIQQHYLFAARRRKHANDDPLPYWLSDDDSTIETTHPAPETTPLSAKTTVKANNASQCPAVKTPFPQTITPEMTPEMTQKKYRKINIIYQDSPSSSAPACARKAEISSSEKTCSATQATPTQPSKSSGAIQAMPTQLPQRRPATFPAPLLTEEAVAQMKNCQTWKESVCMKHHLSIAQVEERLDEFALDCECRGKDSHESLSDAQSHFCNWLLVSLEKASRQQQVQMFSPSSSNYHAPYQPQHTSAEYIEEAKQWAIEQTLRTIRTPSHVSQEIHSNLPF